MKWKIGFVAVTVLSLVGAGWAQKGGGRPSPCKNWKARYDAMPGTAPSKLHVTATCQFPTAGYSVELLPAGPGAEEPPVYVLRRVVHQPEGMAAQVMTDVSVDYSVEASAAYKTVLIKPERKRITVETAQ